MRIKILREATHLSQAELGKIIGVERSTICQYEKENRTPDITILKKIAEHFKVSVDFVMGSNYKLTNPVSKWHSSLQDDYQKATPAEKVYLEAKYGRPIFEQEIKEVSQYISENQNEQSIILSENEMAFIEFLRSVPDNKCVELLNLVKDIAGKTNK
jgi:transcriptional regulator with XRE-family HTH domain